MLTAAQKDEIAAILTKKAPQLACPMCQTRNFTLADGYFNHYLQDDLNNNTLGGLGIPSIAIICSNCGFISQHALGILGLLPKVETDSRNEPPK